MEISISATVVDEAMPVTASCSEMSPLLRQLYSLTDTINNLPGGEGVSEDEIQDFKIVLEGLRTNIEDLSAVERISLTAKRWMQEVRDLCYDTEDFLDRVMMNYGAGVGKSALIKPFNRIQSKQKKRHRQIAADFLGLKARAKGAGERFTRCVLPAQTIKANGEEASSSQQHPLPAELSSVLGVHGRIADRIDGLMDHLVKLLAFNAQQQFKVVSILGFAGVGKTTLARSLYHSYGARFECRAFLQVSRNPDLRGFLISMLSQIKAPRTHASSDVQDLFDNVKKHLQGKRYLIVIDGLWACTTWDIISRALPRDNCYSRIITTTQTEDVAKACCSYNSTDIFEMRPLNNNLQFSGLPFETTTMVANLLECNPMTVAQWRHLQNSIPSSLGTNSTAEGMNEILSLIYHILPHDLKTCLLHFNMYPEDYTIRKDDLVKQWVVEGFVHEVNGKDADVVAKIYFDELINRGLIQPVDINYNNEVLSCTVHHIVLDFIRYKSKEENFITIVDYFQARLGNLDKVRRLSVQFGSVKGAKIPAGSIRMSQIRSLVYFGFFKCVPSVAEYGLLRVLILNVWADKDKICFDLSSIQELFRLRYLKVACNVGIKFPSKIGRLQYLETLDLDARVVGFPLDIVELQNLLHVRLPRETNVPNGIDKMTSLRSLAYFQLSDSSRDNVLNLGKLTNLQDLRLTCSAIQTDRVVVNLECLWSIMEKFSKLTSLILDGGASTTSISCDGLSIFLSSPPPHLQNLELSPQTFVFPSLPEWIGELSKLCNLKIAVRHLPRNNIDILRRLTTLTVLSLSVQTTPADRIVFDKGFQAIRYFKFACTAPCLSFVEGAMVNAVRLKLVFNASSIKQYDLTSVCFQYLTSLKDISVKFGGTSSYLLSGRNAAESALVAAVSKHPSSPIVNVKWTVETPGITARKDSDELEVQEKEERSTAAQKGKHQTSKKQDVVKGKVKQDNNRMLRRSLAMKEPHARGVQEFTFKELLAATDNFAPNRLIGKDGFGSVYTGILPNEQHVAIRRPNEYRGMKEFHAQVTILPTLHHKNIIRLVGYCLGEVEEGFLIFEYMKNGSLFDHLHGPLPLSHPHSPVTVSLKTRIEILLGVSLAIDYLHNYVVPPVIHRDIKASNILLDSSWVPHLSDFDLAVSYDEEHCVESSVCGTAGYIDPEYFCTGALKPTSDVYSFGIVMLEVLTGWKPLCDWEKVKQETLNWEKEEEEEDKHKGVITSLIEATLPFIKAGRLWKVLDKRMAAKPTPRQLQAADLVAWTAMHCVQREGRNRPAISYVVANLQSAFELVHCDESLTSNSCWEFGDRHGEMWSGLGQTATVAQLVGADVGGLVSMIMHAALTARQNKRECEQLARRVFMIGELLPHLEDSAVMRRPEVQGPLILLGGMLREAHELVTSCQGRSTVYQLVTAGRQADKFRVIQRKIDSYLLLFPFISHIDITRRLDRIHRELIPSDQPKPTLSSPSTGSQNHEAVVIQDVVIHGAGEAGEKINLAGLAAATNNFAPHREIGKGGFSAVYMTRLPDGREVAIKRIDSTSMEEDILREATILPSLRHKHIIRLFGWVSVRKKQQRQQQQPFWKKRKDNLVEHIFVYEYLKNGSLHDHLHDPSFSSSPLRASWKMRIKTLIGVAQAIEYLHCDAQWPVIHRDIKPSNILLDAAWAPRLSDFGMSIIWDEENNDGPANRVYGTFGYMDPEYYMTCVAKPTMDVYSFGVTMLEVLTGKRAVFNRKEEDMNKAFDSNAEAGVIPTNLVEAAVPRIEVGYISWMLDKRPEEDLGRSNYDALKIVADTAVRCVQLEGKDRPTISKVVANLQAALARGTRERSEKEDSTKTSTSNNDVAGVVSLDAGHSRPWILVNQHPEVRAPIGAVVKMLEREMDFSCLRGEPIGGEARSSRDIILISPAAAKHTPLDTPPRPCQRALRRPRDIHNTVGGIERRLRKSSWGLGMQVKGGIAERTRRGGFGCS
uniref:non-specific serine/threonine protein kinase n=1 Tax=Oryza punctata TaxID=4537 RepID=A0A0E0MHZ3_ORYPU